MISSSSSALRSFSWSARVPLCRIFWSSCRTKSSSICNFLSRSSVGDCIRAGCFAGVIRCCCRDNASLVAVRRCLCASWASAWTCRSFSWCSHSAAVRRACQESEAQHSARWPRLYRYSQTFARTVEQFSHPLMSSTITQCLISSLEK